MAIAGVMVVAALFYMSEEGEGIRITVRLPIMRLGRRYRLDSRRRP